MEKMKTTKISGGPAPPVVRYVEMLWHAINQSNAATVVVRLDDGACHIFLDSEELNPPLGNLFPHIIRELLRYTGTRIWPWTKSVRDKTCRVEVADTSVAWTMASNNLSRILIIKRA